jgi:SHS2 domain-containing protein
MSPYDILPHTADMRVRASGGTRAGLLESALKGMFAAAGPRPGDGDASVERPFSVKAADFSALLVDFLNEAVSQSDVHKEVYEAVRFDLVTTTEIKGAFIGRPIDGFETQIKAATHGGVAVERNEEGLWEATITFDA